jgi:hypothetical protein
LVLLGMTFEKQGRTKVVRELCQRA